MAPRVVAIIQARLGSTRLPGKVLQDIGPKTMLEHVVERVAAAATVDEVVVATSTDPDDDAIEAFCEEHGLACGRGPVDDVLERFLVVARAFDADVVVRVTSDCPLADPALVDQVVEAFHQSEVDYVANRLPGRRTIPIGLDVEAFGRDALERAAAEATQPYQREHVTPFFYDGTSDAVVGYVDTRPELDHPDERWTVDTPEDLEFVRVVFARLGETGDYGYAAVLRLLEAEPGLRGINRDVRQKTFRETEGNWDSE